MSYVLCGVVVFTLGVILAELPSTASHRAAQKKRITIGPLQTGPSERIHRRWQTQMECFEHMPADPVAVNQSLLAMSGPSPRPVLPQVFF